MEYTTALGACRKCGNDHIQVEGVTKCLVCDANNNGGSGLVVTKEDPGEAALTEILSRVGVAGIPGGKPPTPIKPVLAVNRQVIAAKSEANSSLIQIGTIENALDILRRLPMPKDIKQFKAISKAIKILENLGA